MRSKKSTYSLRKRRSERLRRELRRKSGLYRGRGRPRLSVFRSNQQIYAQVIDDRAGHTLVSASTLDGEVRKTLPNGKGTDKAAAATVGKVLAERALAKGVKEVVFDRGPYLYHGRVKALAEAARSGGLQF